MLKSAFFFAKKVLFLTNLRFILLFFLAKWLYDPWMCQHRRFVTTNHSLLRLDISFTEGKVTDTLQKYFRRQLLYHDCLQPTLSNTLVSCLINIHHITYSLGRPAPFCDQMSEKSMTVAKQSISYELRHFWQTFMWVQSIISEIKCELSCITWLDCWHFVTCMALRRMLCSHHTSNLCGWSCGDRCEHLFRFCGTQNLPCIVLRHSVLFPVIIIIIAPV